MYTGVSIDIYTVLSESLLCAQLVTKYEIFLHLDSKDSDQTELMSRLICAFVCFFIAHVTVHLYSVKKKNVLNDAINKKCKT